MALLLAVLRTAHARGTHHHLALDALDGLSAAPAWRRLFYKHISTYLEGAKAPDTAFKDFQNHVLHPRDGFWGGAPAQAETWYGELVAALSKKDWPAAAYAAGVLGHYCTDPCMPLHTHQTAAETNIHAAVEWTVSTTYDRLAALGETLVVTQRPTVGVGAGWLIAALRVAAQEASQHYETLLAHYDFKRGVVAPEEGLDLVGQRATAAMLLYARRLLATVLDRAIADAAVTPDQVGLAGDALRAFVSLPMARRRNRKAFAVERRLIEAMYDELMATGTVSTTLREDERRIQDLYATEVLASRASAVSSAVEAVAGAPAAATTAATSAHEATAPSAEVPVEQAAKIEPEDPNLDPVEAGDAAIPRGQRLPIERPRPAPRHIEAPLPRSYAEAHAAPTKSDIEADDAVPRAAPAAALPITLVAAPIAIPTQEAKVDRPSLSTYRPTDRTTTPARFLAESDIVDAPSIGPKTAQRFNAVGIDTVADFLKAHPIALADRLDTRHITPEVLTAWQEQARLMLALPEMRGSEAQLLVGAGYRTVEALAAADAGTLCADVLHHALSPEGQRLLREGGAPDMEQIQGIAMRAREVKAA